MFRWQMFGNFSRPQSMPRIAGPMKRWRRARLSCTGLVQVDRVAQSVQCRRNLRVLRMVTKLVANSVDSNMAQTATHYQCKYSTAALKHETHQGSTETQEASAIFTSKPESSTSGHPEERQAGMAFCFWSVTGADVHRVGSVKKESPAPH